MTPLHIQIMLHYYACYSPYAEHDTNHRYSEATTRYTQQLVKMDMIEPVPGEPELYRATARGKVYVERLTGIAPPRVATTYVFSDGAIGTLDEELANILAEDMEEITAEPSLLSFFDRSKSA